jgi:ElaB/YqjD/DUF883 family membrane-anchored ribosome-binding protein
MYIAEKDKGIKSFDDVSKEAAKLKDETVSYLKNKPEEALNEVKDKARDAGKNVYNFFKRNTEKLKDQSEVAAETIKTNPLTSAAAVFATGLVIGAILNRSRKA